MFSIAIDGPAGAGKSTIAQGVAKLLGGNYLDTGAMYRAIGLYMLRHNIDMDDIPAVEAACEGVEITVSYEGDSQRTFLMGEDVSLEVREEKCSAASSMVSKAPGVRERMVALQREIAKGRSVVMDGRDIGTKVLPDATLKVFLTADAKVRAQRRYDELIKKGQAADYDKVLSDILNRDYQDTHRAASPLVKAEDAVEVDTSDMTIEGEIALIADMARSRL